ncbi:MAG: TrkH family potassium uptake protein [Halobacteria archaeon]|nr:TrkH family potassium uptake protein [Halobacteria archaeon]
MSETVLRDLGNILRALSAAVGISILVPLVWGELYAVPGLFLSALVPFVVGTLLVRRYADAEEPGKLHGMVIAALGWGVVAVFGSFPFVLIAWTVALDPGLLGSPEMSSTVAAFKSPLNAVFESMSGFTGTGLTMTRHENVLPHTLQWWRSFTEWIGGIGVIVLTTAILARPGSGSLTLYRSEARSEKIHPSILSTVRTIWWIFVLYSFVSVFLLWLAGMPLWDAVNHAMTGLSTGGFSVTDNSIATYDSALVDFAVIPVMAVGGVAFPVHYLLLQGNLRSVVSDIQTRWVIGIFTLGSVVLSALLYVNGSYSSAFESFRYGAFQFVSAASCAGFQTGAVGDWSAESQILISLAMTVGAAAGSTVGGIKVIRAITLTKGTAYRIAGVFYPDTAVRHLEIDGRTLSDAEVAHELEEAAIISFLWVVFLLAGVFVLLSVVPDVYSLENVIFEVASAQGNVGLSAGITSPEMSIVAKSFLLFNMWIGRLEIIPVLVVFKSITGGFEV